MKKKLIALLIALCLAAGVFSGCQSSELREYTGEEDQTQSSQSPEQDGTEPASAESVKLDFTPVFEAYDPDTVMLTVNGIEVTWRELFYWYYYEVSTLSSYIGGMPLWDDMCIVDTTKTYEEYVSQSALETIKHYCALESKAADAGVTLSEEDQAEIDAAWQSSVDSYGGGDEEEFISYLEQIFLSKELFCHINEINSLYTRMQIETYGEKGEKLDETELLEEAEAQGYMRAKHILISTKDAENNDLTEEEKSLKYAEAEEILAELQAIEDPQALEARMDELINEKSDDGPNMYTDGYTFLPGAMVAEFENAVKELEPYGLSGIVESQFGYHIILRLPLSAQALTEFGSDGTGYTLAQVMAGTMFNNATTAWAEESEVVYSKEYEEMDLSDVFDLAVPAEDQTKE